MKAIFDQIEIKQIVFETGDTDVFVNTTIQQGQLSYETELIIGFSDLNYLINKMQKKLNQDIDISSLFESEKMYNGNLLYTLDIDKKLPNSIILESISFDNRVKQIRA